MARRRLVLSLAALVAVYWVGVIGYVLIEPHVHFEDAVYMVTITLSTVGYKEPFELGPWGKLWTITVIVFGISTAAVALSSLTGLVIEGELGRLIGSRRLETRIKQLKEHVIICGFGRMGEILVRQLTERGVGLVVIELNANRAAEVELAGHPYIVGDATSEGSLERAGIRRAKSLVAVLPSDADNVFVTLTARQMCPQLCIVARAEQFSTEPKLRLAGANRVISPQAIGAERIANVLTRPQLVDLVDVAAKGVELEVDEFRVTQDSPMAGKSLGESRIRRMAEVMVVAIKRPDGSTRFNPGAEEVVNPNDTLITIGQAGAAARLGRLGLLSTAGQMSWTTETQKHREEIRI